MSTINGKPSFSAETMKAVDCLRVHNKGQEF